MMITSAPLIGRLILSILLMLGGLVCWGAARTTDKLATRHERMATFRDGTTGEQDPNASLLAAVAVAIDSDVVHHDALENYWHARYDALTDRRAARDDDPTLLLIAANASFRKSQLEGEPGAMSIDRLDQALQKYAGVLKNSGFHRDAAYNYEYVARLRDARAHARPITRRPAAQLSTQQGGTIIPPAVRPATAANLPIGPTVHGRPGRHPPPTRGEEFEVITPMDFGDREAQPEATPGRRLPRKG